MDAAVAKIKAAGGEVVDVEVTDYDKWNDAEFQVLMYEFKDGINAYLKRGRTQKQGSLEALIAWNKAHATRRCRCSTRRSSKRRRPMVR